MNSLLSQFGLDHTFFIQFGLFFALFLVLSAVYFKPFQALLDARRERTVADRERMEKLVSELEGKMSRYEQALEAAKKEAQAEAEKILQSARKEESAILTKAREEVKLLNQKALGDLAREQERIRKELGVEVEGLAKSIVDKLLAR